MSRLDCIGQFYCSIERDKSVIMACKIIIVLFCILLQVYCQSSKEALLASETFFSNLIEKYESSVLNDETKALIDQEIDLFVNNTLKTIHIPRKKKQVSNYGADKIGAEVFEGLTEVSSLNTTDTQDLYFFKKHNQFFKVLLTSTDVIVYQIYDTETFPITYHPVANSLELRVCKFAGTTWFIVRHSHGFAILHFFHRNGEFTIQQIQRIDVSGVIHFSIWRDHTQMFLGTSSASGFYVYIWLEGNFRLIELLPVETNSSAFFAIEESVHLVILKHRKITILKYSSNTQRFVAIQSISKSFNSITTMQISNRVSTEYFLIASSHERSVLYKLSESVFIPFQEIDPADRIVSVVKNTTMVLFSLKNDTLSVYQYDGWRFVRVNYQLDGIESLKSITWRGEEQLIVKKVEGNWSLMRLSWSKAKTSNEYVEDLRRWCSAAKDKANIIPKFLTDRRRVEASNVNLQKVTVDSVNGISTKKLSKLNDSYNQLLSRLQSAKDLLKKKRTLENPQFSTLQVKSIRVKSSGKSYVKNLVTEMPFDIKSKLRRIDDESLSLKFEKVHVDSLEGFPCPKVGVKLEDIEVEGLINGISFDDVYENALRTSGDQVVTGSHIFDELQVDSLIAPNIEAASTFTRQRFRTKAIYADELNLVDGGLLLPLDGEPVTMTGTLTAKKATFKKLVEQRGRITGKSIKKFAPMVFFPDYHELTGNYTLGNVKVTDMLTTEDIARESGKSLKEIVDGLIPLTDDVPVKLEFTRDRTVWTNITVENLPNWLTRKNKQMVKVTGKKIALNNITVPDSVYSQLPIPKIDTPVCAIAAFMPDIRTSSIRVGDATAKTVVADDVIGAQELNDLMDDCVTSLDEVDLSKKNFTGPVFVENLTVTSFKDSILETFETAMFKWYDPQILKGPITFKNLNVSILNVTEGIKVPMPAEIDSLSVEGNLNVKKLNGIDLDDFLKNVVRINDTIVLKNVIFEGSVEANNITTTNTNINLKIVGPNVSLGNKTILGDLIVEGDFSIPTVAYPSADEIKTLVIDGSIKFKKEPNVVNLNGKNLKELIEGVWMSDRPANLTGSFHMKNITLSQPFDAYHLLNTPNFGPWSTLENRVLSKTKLQEIPSKLHFRNAKIPNIITLGNSSLQSSDPYLNDLLYMTLKKNESRTIPDSWRFEELIITGNLTIEGKINNLNLSTDVARHDVKVNVVTGKKTVKDLAVKYLRGLNFDEWSKDALMQSDKEGPLIIKGRKTFENLHARAITVNGTVMNKKIEKCLMKHGNQIITAPKVIKGSLHAESLIARGLINGINFTDVALNQLGKNSTFQKIKSDVVFNGNLDILGNITIKSLHDIDMMNSKSMDDNFISLINHIDHLKPYVEAIETVGKKRARYWHKFEEVKSQILLPMNDHSSSVTLNLQRLGNCILISISDLECNGQDRYFLKPFSNSTGILINELLSVDDVPVVVQVSSGPQSRITIYQYDYRANSFSVTQSVRLPGITAASVLNHNGVVWIVALVNSEMLLLRYETWNDLQKYRMPSSTNFLLDKVPATDETILVRDDGMWKLDGLAGPRHVFKAEMHAEKIESFHYGNEFFVRLSYRNGGTRLLKARYVGV